MANRKTRLISWTCLLGLGLLVSSCAVDGGLAFKSKPLDKEATRLAICQGAQKVDIAFWTISAASPDLIPSKVMDVEGGIVTDVGFQPGKPDAASLGSICAKVYSGDLDVAINTAILATANISTIIRAWSK